MRIASAIQSHSEADSLEKQLGALLTRMPDQAWASTEFDINAATESIGHAS